MIFNPAHPGEVLRDYLGEMTVAEAASRLGITRAHLSRILNGHAGITANTSLRLSAALCTSPDFWLKMQMHHDLWLEQQQSTKVKIHPFPHVAAPQGPGRAMQTQPRRKEMVLSEAQGA
jgi:addiction module HigA family antidote